MKLLVTGGAGYIGSHMVEILLDHNYEVVVFDNLSTGHRESVNKNALLVEGDLRNQTQVDKLFAEHKFEGILHFASFSVVSESMEKPWLYLRDNVLSASYLIEAAVRTGVGRFILSSTANMYDKATTMPISEKEQVVPGSPYGESKAMIERQLEWMDRIYGLKYCALRYFNAAGAHPNGHIGEDHAIETHIIPIVLQTALGQRKQVTIYGSDYPTPDGTCVRDYIHVMDLASAHVMAFEALTDGRSRTYNLGSGEGHSVNEVIEMAEEIAGRDIPRVIGDRRAGDAAELIADSTMIVKELGWKRKYPALQDIIQTAWNWHHSHPNGFRS